MDKLKLNNKISFIIFIVIIIINIIYNIYNPSFKKMCDIAYYKYVKYAHFNLYNITDFKGPLLDLNNKNYYIFTWEKVSNKDTLNVKIFFSKKWNFYQFTSGYDSNIKKSIFKNKK